MPRKNGQTNEQQVRIRTAVDIPNGPEITHDPDPFERYIEDTTELQRQELVEKKRKRELYRKLRDQAYIPIVCILAICALLSVYALTIHEKIVGTARQEVNILANRAKQLRTEITAIENIKTGLYADPKVAKEMQTQERKLSLERVIADKFSMIVSKLATTSTEEDNSVSSRTKVSDALGMTAGLLSDLDSYEKTFGAVDRSQLIAKLISNGNMKTRVANLDNVCIRGGITATKVYFRTGLVTDYIMLLSAEHYTPADVLQSFNGGFSQYSEVLPSNDFYKITEAIGIAEASIYQVSKH